MSPAWPALVGGAAALLAACEALREVARSAPPAARAAAAALDAAVRIGSEGRAPGTAERRRLLLAGAVALFLLGLVVAGPLAGAALGAAGPWAVSRALAARRRSYRRAVEDGAAGLAVSVADAIGGGHSLRGALAEAARSVGGPPGAELRRVAAELGAGARTEQALEAMRSRVRSARVDTIVAACLLQRRAGGDLARLLRDCATAFEDDARLADEARAATAQARFTGLVVVLLPLGGALLAELASPGFLMGLWESFLTAWLVGLALVLQIVGAVLIARLAKTRW
jgi:tight adherence protein B